MILLSHIRERQNAGFQPALPGADSPRRKTSDKGDVFSCHSRNDACEYLVVFLFDSISERRTQFVHDSVHG